MNFWMQRLSLGCVLNPVGERQDAQSTRICSLAGLSKGTGITQFSEGLLSGMPKDFTSPLATWIWRISPLFGSLTLMTSLPANVDLRILNILPVVGKDEQ